MRWYLPDTYTKSIVRIWIDVLKWDLKSSCLLPVFTSYRGDYLPRTGIIRYACRQTCVAYGSGGGIGELWTRQQIRTQPTTRRVTDETRWHVYSRPPRSVNAPERRINTVVNAYYVPRRGRSMIRCDLTEIDVQRDKSFDLRRRVLGIKKNVILT